MTLDHTGAQSTLDHITLGHLDGALTLIITEAQHRLQAIGQSATGSEVDYHAVRDHVGDEEENNGAHQRRTATPPMDDYCSACGFDWPCPVGRDRKRTAAADRSGPASRARARPWGGRVVDGPPVLHSTTCALLVRNVDCDCGAGACHRFVPPVGGGYVCFVCNREYQDHPEAGA